MNPDTATNMDWLPTADTGLMDAAVAYATHGFRVHPVHGIRVSGAQPRCTCHKRERCATPGKHPLGKAWQKTASSDVDTVRDAFRNVDSDCNIGLAMGGDSRVIVVDIDGSLGRESLARLVAKHGPLPETLSGRSGRKDGGDHLLFFVPLRLDLKRIRNSAGLLPGIDTRGTGGQIVAPPSVHATGTRYEWVNRVPVAEIPDWLYDVVAAPETPSGGRIPVASNVVTLATSSRYIDAVLANACREISTCREGGRNQLLFAKAATVFEYFLGAGLDTLAAKQALGEAGRSSGLPSAEVTSVLENALSAAQDSPRTVPPPKPRVTVDGEVLAVSTGVADNAWENDLLRTSTGTYKNSFGNICKILRHASQFAGRLRYNDMTLAPEIDGRTCEDRDTGTIRELIENEWHFSPGDGDTEKAVICVAKEQRYHPVQQYLTGLVWDREARISRVCVEILGVQDSELYQAVIRKWFIATVARAMQPGCKADTALVLLGPQGVRKTTFFEVLASKPWFGNSKMDIRDKDSVLQLHSAWIYEWGEIEQITSTRQASEVKGFLTINTDTVRPPYGRSVVKAVRSGVIVGSTNRAQFLDDPTGARRFWVISVAGRIDTETLSEWRNQLWAEAVALYRSGEEWHLSEALEAIREEDADAYHVEDSWEDAVREAVAGLAVEKRTTRNILIGMGVDVAKQSLGENHRLGKIMRRMGYYNEKIRLSDGSRPRVWQLAQRPSAMGRGSGPGFDQ